MSEMELLKKWEEAMDLCLKAQDRAYALQRENKRLRDLLATQSIPSLPETTHRVPMPAVKQTAQPWPEPQREVLKAELNQARARIAELEAELAARPAHEAPADLHSASDGEWIGDPEPNADDVAAVYDASTATFGNNLYEMIKNTPQPTRRERRIMMAHCIAMWKAYHNALSIPTPADLPIAEGQADA